jgi:CBS domain-containing protein
LEIGKYMQKNFRTVAPHTPMREIARLFFETGESVLPVAEEDGRLAGLITIDDFILIFLPDYIDLIRNVDFLHDFGALERSTFSVEERLLVAEDLMREDVPPLEETESVMKAAASLHKHGIKRIPVVSGSKLVGMMGLGEVCRAIYDMEGSQ